ncbi:hypothetical protein LAZ67_21001672, partial [Cordylochernes scorpioides]
MEEQTNPSNDTAEQTIPKQETTFEEEETSPPQDNSADPLTQIAETLSKLLVARSPREIDVSPYDSTFEAQSFFDNFDAQADRTELTYTDRLRKLPCYLQGKSLQYFRSLRLDRLFYIEARQRLIDLFPATTEASFARFLAIKLTPQMPLEDYYQNKTVMGMKLDLPADILIESLTDGLPVADQRLIATVQPNTIKEWFDIVSRIRGTQCATSAVYQRQVDKAPHPTYHNPPPRYNNQRPSRVTYQVTPPPSPCKYCNAMHWHSQCEQRFPRDRTRPVYSARPRTTTVPKRGTHTQPKVQSPSHVPQVQAASQDDSASPASSSTSCLHVADSTPIICSPTISPTYDIEISIPSNAAPQLEHCPHELHRILYEFSQVFSTNKYNVPKLNIPPVKINTTTDKIIALRPYRVPLHDQQEIQTQIEQMLQYGIIAPSVSPYASPITLVTKRDKTKRFCIDYRKLNEIIAPDVHPLPLIETILDKLSKAKYYSSVDIASAYWQVEIEPNSRNLLAFVTLDSQYEFCRLPYGFKNSPQIYHRAINQVMQKYKLNFVTHYFDDFIIFSDTLEDHLQHLQQFLTVCQHENIKLNYNKCSFLKTNIDFLGYTVTAGTYAPQTRNLDTINAIKPPTNQKTLQSFLGAVNVYNKFIADYARLRAPLNKLLKKDVKWNWDPDCQQAFTTLKESLTSKPVLHLYQVGLPCRLYCDASTQGIAGILKQVHPDGQIHPVQYFSRALRAHERNYTVSELECLAIVESVDKFRIYLTGIKFTIYTDHQALQWLKTIKNPSGRLFRWSLRLSTYNYEIHYLKGSQQYEADLLSRNPFVGFISTDIIKQHQPTASPFNIDTNGLHTITQKGVTKIIIPETLQHTLMNKVHQEYNHPGISQMTRIITTQYYWKGISKSIEKFVRSCHTCQIIKRPKGKPYGALGQIPPPQQPFDLISIDTIAGFSKYGHSKTYLHVIVDHLTRYAWTFPSKSTSTLTYIQTLKNVLQQGSPKRLLSDRAPAFTSEKFRKFLITQGIQPLLTTSNNPQANGLIERLNATITGKLRLAYLENPKASWTQLVKRVTQTYNNTPHSVTSFPPTYLMFNVIPPDLRTHLNPYPEINIAREIASSRTQNKHKKDEETFDKQHRTPHFEVNDLVLVKNYRHPDTGKLAPYFTGPYKIIEIISPNVVRIDRPNQPLNRDSDTIHVNKLKYYTEDVLYITPPQPRFVQHPQRLPQDVYFIEFNHLTPDIFETQLSRIIPPTSSQPFLHLSPDFNNLQIYQNNDALPTNVYKFTKCKQDLCPTQPRETDMFTTFPSNQSCLHVADSTPIICSPTISPTYDIEISIPSNAAPQLEHCPHELHRILYEFSQVFSTNKYNVPKLNIPPVKINTTTDKIIALRPYRVPLHDQQEIQTQIEQMLQYGIIAPSVSPYASPITLVTKRDKTKRFCIDYRKLNEIIAPDVHPLPLIETILDKLSKAKYYSSVDIASAYWQVEIEPNSRNLLAFVTLDSQYEFCRLPYGFKNSPQIYHRAINQVMQKYKLNFVTHYFDDFIIFSDTLEDHLQHLQQFLTVCQHENIKLNYNKCSFLKTNIDFLGYTVTAGTYAPQTRNLDTINAIKPPTNQKTLQSFLGAVNVYNKFIADYARLRAPLNKLLKKDVKWNWDPDCQQAFTTLKESLTSKPVLHLYQVGLPCRLYCDASTQGIAGILKQVHPDGQIHPVQYFSRALRAHERNYTVSELECLAIVESVDKFRIYLTGIKFTIYTDHQALQWLKTIKNPSGRLFRWSLRLSTYNYEIHYLKGSQQYEADLLSRNPFVGFISTDIIKQHQPTASPFNIDTNGLHTITQKGVTKIIIPETLQHTLMNKVHQEYNHPGISQMTRIITTQYYWKGISKSIEKFVRSCHTCQIIKRPKGKPYGALGQIPPPQQPFDLISIDTIAGFSKYGHSKTYLHVIVDHLTRYAWTFPSKSTSTLTYIQTLKNVLQQGSPKRLLSDRAPAFTSEKFRKFLITQGIQPLLTTSNNPQANGLIERLNATITGKLRLAYLENPKASWTQLVKRVTQTYNNTPHSVTSFPPTYLMFNVIPPDLRTHLNPYPEINIAREIASSRTQNKHKKDEETFDKQHRTPHFEVNDLVLVKNYRHPDTGKLAPYFTGPYKIIEIISPNVVRIDRPNQPLNRDSDTIHVNKLKYYTEDVLYITPPQPRFVQHPQRLPQDVYFIEFNHLTPDIFETQLSRIIPPTSSQPFLHLSPDFNNLQIYQNNDALPTNVYKFTKCKQDLCPTQPRETDMFTTFPSNQSCLHVADSTPIICSPTISPTYDIEISIPSNAAPQLEHCPHELHRILYEFSQVFSTNKYNVPKLNIPPVKINTTTDKIIALRPYRVPLHDQQEIQTQIEQMLQYGIIAPSVSPYASPITLVTKRDKTKRFCIDYRKLNEIIAPDVHPLPLIETILDKLSKAKYYSSVDIASAYWQVEIEPNSRNLLAFVTLDSQYEFCRLPYGFKNSPQIYHRAINQVMQKYKLNFVTHYFDDFIIFSDTLEDHLQHLQQFLTVCQHENIKLNYNKCSFLKTNIDFLGYTVTAGTYAPQTRNLDTINAIKPPTNQKTLQSFLGAVNVYNKFIADYARLRAPLNKLLKKDVKWNWDPDCQQAFTTLKESLTSKPVLHLYQVGLPCRLYCDASTQGIAGILKQVHPDGQIHPVQYFSRALRAHERNYTVSELECLAIVESVDKFRIYLTGIKFTIYTDHQALQWLKTIKNPSGRLFRWSLRLSTYNYEIHYLKGSQQYEADLLSRNPFVGFISTDIIKQHQPTASPFNIDTNGLHTITQKGVTKIIIPETLQHTLMNKVHQEYNHPGISQMTRIITTQYYWKGISKSIEKFVRSCHTCQIIKRPKGKPYGALGQIPPPQQPFDLISIDTIAGFSKYGHSKTYLHVIVDHLTRYAWTFPSKSTSTLTYIQTLKNVLQQGSPKRLLSDRAPAFTSEKFRKFLITQGIQPLLTTSNNPQANGLIERLNATITGKLRLAYLENPKASWTQLVKRVTQTYNNTPHSVTSFPPTYLMFNVIPPDLRTHLNPYPEINIAREIASSRTQNKHKKDEETFDKQHRTPHFEVNDLVLVKNYRHPDTGKLAPYFTGPYKIIEIISPNVVRIDRPNQPLNRDSDTIHVNKLKYYTEDVLYITPPQPRFVQHPQRLPQDVYFIEFNHLTPDIFETQLSRIIPPTSSQPFLHLSP